MSENKKIILVTLGIAGALAFFSKVVDFKTAYGYSSGYGYGYYYIVHAKTTINASNKTSYAFLVNNALSGGVYHYSIDDGNPATPAVTGSAPVPGIQFWVQGLNVSGLDDGPVSITFSITDSEGRQGTNAIENTYKVFTKTTVMVSKDGKKSLGGKKTSKRNLFLVAKNAAMATHMMVSTDPNFSGKTWEPYKKKRKIHLKNKKNVTQRYYVKFKDANGAESGVYEKELIFK